MFDEKKIKAGVMEQLTGVNAVTLRSWRRKGLLAGMGFQADGSMARYSFIDACIIALAFDLDRRASVAMPAALEIAIQFRPAVLSMLEDETDHHSWTLFAMIEHRGSGYYQIEPIRDLLQWATFAPVFGSLTTATFANVGAVAQNVHLRLVTLEGAK